MKTQNSITRHLAAICNVSIIIILLSLSSCYTARVYAPQKQNIPGLEKKHDIRAAISLAGASDLGKSRSVEGVALEAAYAATNHLGLMVNYSSLSRDASNKIRKIEAGAGYFKAFGPNVVFETYTGLSFGKAFDKANVMTHVIEGTLNNFTVFIQPSLLIKSKHWGLGLALKTSFTDFNNLRYTPNPLPEDMDAEDTRNAQTQINNLKSIESYGTYTIIEPSLTFRGGLKNVKLEVQFGLSALSGDLRKHAYTSFGSIGLHVAIPGRKRSQSCPQLGKCK